MKEILLKTTCLTYLFVVVTNAGWMKNYGRDGNGVTSSIQQTEDGGYIISSCFSQPAEDFGDAWLIKTDSNGDTMWTRTYGGDRYDLAWHVQQTSDGGYILTGTSYSYGPNSLLLIKTDQDGNEEWMKLYGTNKGAETGSCVQQTSDGGYIVVGSVMEADSIEYALYLWLLKTDSQGDTLWTRLFGSGLITNDWLGGSYVIESSDGNYVVTGQNGTYSGYFHNTRVWIFKTDTLGDVIWGHKYGVDKSGSMSCGNYLQETPDGGYIIAANHNLSYNNIRIWLLKTDNVGDTVWTKDYGEGTALGADIMTDGGYIVTSTSRSLIRADEDGNLLWTRNLGIEGHSVLQTPDGGYALSGIRSSDGGYDLWAAKTDSLGYVAVDEKPAETRQPTVHLPRIGSEILVEYQDYPHGFHANIFNASGRKVDELHSTQPSGTLKWGVGYGCYGPGVYFIRDVSDHPVTHKVVLVR